MHYKPLSYLYWLSLLISIINPYKTIINHLGNTFTQQGGYAPPLTHRSQSVTRHRKSVTRHRSQSHDKGATPPFNPPISQSVTRHRNHIASVTRHRNTPNNPHNNTHHHHISCIHSNIFFILTTHHMREIQQLNHLIIIEEWPIYWGISHTTRGLRTRLTSRSRSVTRHRTKRCCCILSLFSKKIEYFFSRWNGIQRTQQWHKNNENNSSPKFPMRS